MEIVGIPALVSIEVRKVRKVGAFDKGPAVDKLLCMFKRKLGPDAHAAGAQTRALLGCPDIWELDSGDFAIIGIDITEKAKPHLPPTATCGPDERIVFLPRQTLVLARVDIPAMV